MLTFRPLAPRLHIRGLDGVQYEEGDARTSVGEFPGSGGALGASQLLDAPPDRLPLTLPSSLFIIVSIDQLHCAASYSPSLHRSSSDLVMWSCRNVTGFIITTFPILVFDHLNSSEIS